MANLTVVIISCIIAVSAPIIYGIFVVIGYKNLFGKGEIHDIH
jgi:hypothetical protein